MKAFDPKASLSRSQSPSEELRIAITFPRPNGPGPVHFGARLSPQGAAGFAPDPLDVDRATTVLSKHGFTTTRRGRVSVSMRCSRQQYESVFGTRLGVFTSPSPQAAQVERFYFPPADAPWQPDPGVKALIDEAYIQWPHIYMSASAAHAQPAGGAVPVPGYHHLSVPADVNSLLNVTAVHRRKITGQGVRVAMIDSGFDYSHQWFDSFRAQAAVVLAPGAADRHADRNGHGTGESANLFSVAPDIAFVGVKVDNDANPAAGATILEGFQEALRHDPHVISVSMGYDLRLRDVSPQAALPNNLVALEAEIQAAIARGICVVFSAGNGHYAFPGMMPDIISAGGVYVDSNGGMQASDYASAFPSAVYPGRSVPDFCGLVGMQPHATYIRLPIPRGCQVDRDMAPHDGTTPNDGWGVFSGTSAAAPQIAGVCALLLQANPGLKPAEIKSVLSRTARDVVRGAANQASDMTGNGGLHATTGYDGATGAGLVDALAALQQL